MYDSVSISSISQSSLSEMEFDDADNDGFADATTANCGYAARPYFCENFADRW